MIILGGLPTPTPADAIASFNEVRAGTARSVTKDSLALGVGLEDEDREAGTSMRAPRARSEPMDLFDRCAGRLETRAHKSDAGNAQRIEVSGGMHIQAANSVGGTA